LSGYTQFTDRHEKANMKCEILIWNLQRDMIELFSTNYPWNVQAHKKWTAHDASIIDICYLAKSQLIVTAGMDQTIRFWDPVQMAFELTDPSNNPHAQMKPGYYKPLQAEQTKSN
jgi:WD40 repeat protein